MRIIESQNSFKAIFRDQTWDGLGINPKHKVCPNIFWSVLSQSEKIEINREDTPGY